MIPEERRHRRFDWAVISVLVVFLIVAGGATMVGLKAFGASGEAKRAAANANRAIAQIAREGRERRDDSCGKDEREHLATVNRLRGTYEYLKRLSAVERETTLNRFVLRSLPELERQAHTDVAPAFCDEPGEKAETLWFRTHGKRGAPPVGLREPDPTIPERPRGLFKTGR